MLLCKSTTLVGCTHRHRRRMGTAPPGILRGCYSRIRRCCGSGKPILPRLTDEQNTLQRLGITPAPAEPEEPRPAQPEPLNQSELDRIKLVCYLPESSEVSVSRLPFPPVYLSANQSTCAICQENFEEPKEGRTILLKADKLRLLGCSHVYHVSIAFFK